MSDQAPAPSAPAAAAPQAEPQVNEEVMEGVEASDEGSAPAAAPAAASKSEAKAAAKEVGAKEVKGEPGTFKLKVDGEEIEMSQEELVKYAQMGKAGQKKMQEAAQIRKEAAQLVKMLREDPEAVLADPAILGSNEKVLEFAQKILARKIEDEQKSPEVLRAEKAERELEQLRRQQKEEMDARERAQFEAMIKEQEALLEEQITEAIESSGLPKSPFVLKRIADVMISAGENDKDITPKQAMNIVKREMQKDLKEYFDLSPDEALEELLGDSNIKRLRKRQLAKVKAAQTTAPATPNTVKPASTPKKEEPNKKENLKDWLRSK